MMYKPMVYRLPRFQPISPLASTRACTHALVLLVAILAAGAASAQTPSATPAGVDEAKIPDWIKKQADNPVKWIIQQDNKPKAKAAAEDKPVSKKAVARKPGRAEEEVVIATPVATQTSKAAQTTPATPPTPSAASTNAAKPTEEPVAVEVPVAVPVAPIPTVVALAPPPEPKAAPAPLIEELVPINQPQPVLGRDVLQAGIRSGRVMVSFTVNPDGSVKDATVTGTSDRLLNRSVITAVKQWIYKPISNPQTKTVEIAFQLD